MDTERIISRLRELPPDLPEPDDRFEQIAGRVRRRRRQQTTMAAAAGVAVLALAVPVANGLLPESAVGPAGGVLATSSATGNAGDPPQVRPGGDRVTHLSEPLTATHTGTATVQLGERPDGANGVAVWLDCLSAGEFIYPDGASTICEVPEDQLLPPEDFAGAAYVIGLASTRDTIEIEATEGSSWQITTSYVSSTETEWGVNAKGETYGVQNENGEPDLIAVTATNGEFGYAYVADMNAAYGPEPTSPEHAYRMQEEREGQTVSIPVYESDGETVVGEFVLGDATGGEGDSATATVGVGDLSTSTATAP
ncbi:peptidase M56 family protein [Ornithinimicrobium cavernae]|uniref:peptidase M56 family protein n=1 Tax=Ornithinimicrobium cavernae TaxID=2666047 RepID=UPI000D68A0BD|nr:peptidase M56 family protein [Ornithinimicrobium cavernae]